MSFLKAFFASFLALVAFCFLSFLVLVIFVAIASSGSEVAISKNSILKLDLDGPINERQRDNPLAGLSVGDDQNIGLLQLLDAIHHAKSDNNISGIVLQVSEPRTGFSTLEEIRGALADFKKSGKWIYAYGEDYSDGAYYLSSVADKVFLNPAGMIEFDGLTVEISFYKKLLDKLEIKPEVFRVGEYKSAVEPFLLDKMSPQNRLQLTQLANGIYGQVLTEIGQSRSLPASRLRQISDSLLVQSPELAVRYGLIDSLTYEDGFKHFLKSVVGIGDHDKLHFVGYNAYHKSYKDNTDAKDQIAVIVAEGAIQGGDDDQWNVISSDRFVKEINRAAENTSVKAIVLRVNSPGGEFQASDVIWNAIHEARKKKPVIASMSDYGASGGYYISMACDTIVAEPTTITGSIGIFGLTFDLSNFLGDKLGITFDKVSTGNYQTNFTMTRPLSDGEKAYLQHTLDRNYATFTEKAADGRAVPVDSILKVASGRVWIGTDAMQRHLIDTLGGFDEALSIAAGAAHISKYQVRFYPPEKSILEKLLNAGEDLETQSMKHSMGETYTWYQQCRQVLQESGVQARMPFKLSIH